MRLAELRLTTHGTRDAVSAEQRAKQEHARVPADRSESCDSDQRHNTKAHADAAPG